MRCHSNVADEVELGIGRPHWMLIDLSLRGWCETILKTTARQQSDIHSLHHRRGCSCSKVDCQAGHPHLLHIACAHHLLIKTTHVSSNRARFGLF